MHGDTYLAGWRLRSSILIDSFLSWGGDERPPDVIVSRGAMPQHANDLVLDGPVLRISRDRSCWFTAPTGDGFFVNPAGTEVTVAAGHSGSELTSLLLRPILAILCHKHRLLPIHASCVEIGGHAVAFAGPSGVGKSVLAAAFLQAGFPLLADDIVAVDPLAPGGPLVLPALRQLKLWRDSLDALGFDAGKYRHCRPGLDRYEIPFASNFPAPLKLAAIYHLRRDRRVEGTSIQAVRGSRALQAAANAICYGNESNMLAGGDASLQSATALCAAVPAYALAYLPGFDLLPATVATLHIRHGERS